EFVLTNNTLIGSEMFELAFDTKPDAVVGQKSARPFRVDASRNVIDMQVAALTGAQIGRLGPTEQYVPAEGIRALLPAFIGCGGRHNSSAVKRGFLAYYHHGLAVPVRMQAPKSLAEWEQFWKIMATGSFQAKAFRYLGGPLAGKAMPSLETITA